MLSAVTTASKLPTIARIKTPEVALNRITIEPKGLFRRIPLGPHPLLDRRTRTQDAVILCHLGVPRLDRETWQLTIDGLVKHPLTLRFDDLIRYPKVEVETVHQCAGSPLQPFVPERRICNVVWGGARLSDILAKCLPQAAATYIWSYGADYGEFSGVEIDAYLKDLPIERVRSDVLIAYEINGEPLPAEQGFPARLVIPGFYGTNSVKWLTRMTLADHRASGPFTTRWYNDPVLDDDGRVTGATTPVWSIAPESVIVVPAPEATLKVSVETEIWGWALADGGIRNLQVTTDNGTTWSPAMIEPVQGRTWQRFSLMWTPMNRGPVTLASRAVSESGEMQPMSGRRNAIHSVPVQVA
jgi:DMSO/TMAO reductase YedYZ molybdopterin-dependent catalytic subunit